MVSIVVVVVGFREAYVGKVSGGVPLPRWRLMVVWMLRVGCCVTFMLLVLTTTRTSAVVGVVVMVMVVGGREGIVIVVVVMSR
jgi:hypothetical protein